MRIVLINHCHPATPHVCAVRAREFARALARLGLEVVLLTQTLEGQPVPIPASDLAQTLAAHDFAVPYYLACAPVGFSRLRRLRAGQLPALIRRPLTLWQLLVHGGMFTDWRNGTQPYLEPLATQFKPDVVWATFGNTDSWNIAQQLAHTARCPWIADVKDHWDAFIPAPLRGMTARRYRDAAAMTALSKSHVRTSGPWFGRTIDVVYSGFPTVWRHAKPETETPGLQISLTGGLYDDAPLQDMCAALAAWFRTLNESDRAKVKLVYAGNDGDKLRAALQTAGVPIPLDDRGFVSLDDLFAIYRRSRINMFLRTNRVFHHKILELIAADRPILCYPEESDEAKDIVADVSAMLYSCDSVAEIQHALTSAMGRHFTHADGARLDRYSWDAQAEKLLAVFNRVVRR